MYITLQNGGVVALEPETGKELWRFETPVRGRSVRAVSYWPGDNEAGARLLYGAGDKLWALDPETGKAIESFGNKGVADVHPGQPASAPAGGGGSELTKTLRADRVPAAAARLRGGHPGGQGGRGGPAADAAAAASAAAASRSRRRRRSTRTSRSSAARKARTRSSVLPAIRRPST